MGKSTVLNGLHAAGYQVHPEPLPVWGELLKRYYANKKRYGYDLQALIIEGFQIFHESFVGGLIERSPSGSRVFLEVMSQEGNLTTNEFERLVEMLRKSWLSDVTIYIQGESSAGITRIHNRQQVGDSGITLEYLERVHSAYEKALIPGSGIDWGQLHRVDGMMARDTVRNQIQCLLEEGFRCRRCHLIASSAPSDMTEMEPLPNMNETQDSGLHAVGALPALESQPLGPRESVQQPCFVPERDRVKVSWTYRNQRQLAEVQARQPQIHQDPHHRPRHESMFREELIMCRVQARPTCQCPGDVIYRLCDDPNHAEEIHKIMRCASEDRTFTAWGDVCWFNAGGVAETAPLSACWLSLR